jgi:hypothetical protein
MFFLVPFEHLVLVLGDGKFLKGLLDGRGVGEFLD